MKIYVDAGHGTYINGVYDSGAIGVNNAIEADIVLAIAKHLQAELKRNNFTVKMSRETEKTTKVLNQRTREANDFGADIVVSLHCNAFEDPSANGTETIIYSKGGNAEKIANKVQSAVLAVLNTRSRGIVERRNLAILRDTKAPAILCEFGFITNKADCAKLVSATYQKEIAKAVCKAICEYYGIKYNGENKMTKDNTPDAYAKEAVDWAIKEGILYGNENGDYMLHSNVTRQDVLVFLHRALKK